MVHCLRSNHAARGGRPLGADVLSDATPVIHTDAGPDHTHQERGERASEGAQRPSRVATDGGADKSQQFCHGEWSYPAAVDAPPQKTISSGTGYGRRWV